MSSCWQGTGKKGELYVWGKFDKGTSKVRESKTQKERGTKDPKPLGVP